MIRRLLQVLLLVGLGVGAWLVRPGTIEPVRDRALEPQRPAFAGCFGAAERDVAALVSVGSIVRGDVIAQLVSPAGTAPVKEAVDGAGAALVDFGDLGAAGTVGVLTEFPSADAAAAVTMRRGDATAATAMCTPPLTGSAIAIGASTGTGESAELVMTNPYAVDAVVAVESSSENGDDSASELASVLVPARTTVTRDLDGLLPLRTSLSVRLRVERGAVHAGILQEAQGDVASVEAVAPAQDWWLPVLAVANSGARLVIATDSPLPVNVVVDSYRAGTVSEAVFEGVVEARSQLDLDVGEVGELPMGIRVSSDGPVVVGLVVNGEQTRALSPATTLSTEWLLPGVGAFDGARAWVFNAGEVSAELVLQPLASGLAARAVEVPARAAVSVPMETGGAGMLIRSSSEVAVLWSTRNGGLALGKGHPVAVLTD